MEKTVLRFFAPSILSVLFFSCASDIRSKSLDNWIGKYGYGEEPVQAIAGYNMVMIWDLSISNKNDTCQGELEINGQQTYMKLIADISGDTNSIAIVFNRQIDGATEKLKKGDTLFTLSRTAGKLKTKWVVLEPRLLEHSPKECNCFVEEKNSSR